MRFQILSPERGLLRKFFHDLLDGSHLLFISMNRQALAADRLVYFEIDSCVPFHADDAQEDAQRLGGFAAFADYFPHIIGMNNESQQHTHLVNSARRFDRFRVVGKCLYRVFEKCLIWFHKGYIDATKGGRLLGGWGF